MDFTSRFRVELSLNLSALASWPTPFITGFIAVICARPSDILPLPNDWFKLSLDYVKMCVCVCVCVCVYVFI